MIIDNFDIDNIKYFRGKVDVSEKIIEKYLSKLDRDLLHEKYDLYPSIFLNEEKQKNIRSSKEEQYQEGFIRDLFVSVLGYTIKPEANYNILTEFKNEVKNKRG